MFPLLILYTIHWLHTYLYLTMYVCMYVTMLLMGSAYACACNNCTQCRMRTAEYAWVASPRPMCVETTVSVAIQSHVRCGNVFQCSWCVRVEIFHVKKAWYFGRTFHGSLTLCALRLNQTAICGEEGKERVNIRSYRERSRMNMNSLLQVESGCLASWQKAAPRESALSMKPTQGIPHYSPPNARTRRQTT